MCLTMTLVSPTRAVLLSDGIAASNDGRVVSTSFSKLFRLPSGDWMTLTGTRKGLEFVHSLQAGPPISVFEVMDAVAQWCALNPDGGATITLVGKNGHQLFAAIVWFAEGEWRVRKHDFTGESSQFMTCGGFLESDEFFACLNAASARIAEEPDFDIAADRMRALFKSGHGSAPGKIGGTVFEARMHVHQSVEYPNGGVPWADRFPNAADGGRSAWDTLVQKQNAVDSSGNILLKNRLVAVGSTSSPTTTSLTFASDVPEMSITASFKGNPVLVSFNCVASIDSGIGKFRIFRDSTNIGSDGILNSAVSQTTITIIFIDMNATAGSHTYHVMWEVTSGGETLTAQGVSRSLQLSELG